MTPAALLALATKLANQAEALCDEWSAIGNSSGINALVRNCRATIAAVRELGKLSPATAQTHGTPQTASEQAAVAGDDVAGGGK